MSIITANDISASFPTNGDPVQIRDISTNVFAMKAPGVHVIAVAPQNLPAGKLTRDKKKLQKTFDQGV